MAASRAATGAVRLAERALHMRVQPRPANLAESREILRILERFGEVVYFKNLRYENHDPAPNSMLAIFAKEADATKFLSASPLFFSLEPSAELTTPSSSAAADEATSEFDRKIDFGKEGAEEMLTPGKFTHPSWAPEPPSSSEQNVRVLAPARQLVKPQPREFRLIADISKLDHRRYIDRQPFHGRYNVQTKNLVQEDLAQKVPLFGLSDVNMWRPENLSRIVRKAQTEREGRLTLRQLWERGMARKADGQHEEIDRKGRRSSRKTEAQ